METNKAWIFLLLLADNLLSTEPARVYGSWTLGAPDPLQNVKQLADCLYNHNDLSEGCIPTYCQPSVTVHVS